MTIQIPCLISLSAQVPLRTPTILTEEWQPRRSLISLSAQVPLRTSRRKEGEMNSIIKSHKPFGSSAFTDRKFVPESFSENYCLISLSAQVPLRTHNRKRRLYYADTGLISLSAQVPLRTIIQAPLCLDNRVRVS